MKTALPVIIALISIISSSLLHGDGVILVKSNPSQSPQYWAQVGFKKIDIYPGAKTVELLSGQSKTFRNDEVGETILLPEWGSMIAANESEWEQVLLQRQIFINYSTKFPQLKSWAASVVIRFDELLEIKASGQILYRGRSISPADYRNLGTVATTAGLSLVVGEKTFHNVKVTSVKEGKVGILHEGGSATLEITALSEAQSARLQAASPGKFGAYIKKQNDENKVKRAQDMALQAELDKQSAMQQAQAEKEKAMAAQKAMEQAELAKQSAMQEAQAEKGKAVAAQKAMEQAEREKNIAMEETKREKQISSEQAKALSEALLTANQPGPTSKDSESNKELSKSPKFSEPSSSFSDKLTINADRYELYMRGYNDLDQGEEAKMLLKKMRPVGNERLMCLLIIVGSEDRKNNRPVRYQPE